MEAVNTFIACAVLGAGVIGNAWADRGHGHWGYGNRGHFGITIGVPIGPWYYPPAYYYPPYPYYYRPYSPAVVVQQPQVYIEQPQAAESAEGSAGAPRAGYWYYCVAAKGYYPYIKECPAGWVEVPPQPSKR